MLLLYSAARTNPWTAVARGLPSLLAGVDRAQLAAYHATDVDVLRRDEVEGDPEPVLAAAEEGDVAFLTGVGR